jgi:hypothetical protein
MGEGTLKYNNGDTYNGQFINNLKHGEGEIKYKNSEIISFKGTFLNDFPYKGKI